MDKILKPDKLRIDPNDSSAGKEFKHWKRCFENVVDDNNIICKSLNLGSIGILSINYDKTDFIKQRKKNAWSL